MAAVLDHLVLAVADLDAAVADFERRTGVRPVDGGAHPGRGTRNALVGLNWQGGSRHYLELLGLDPAQAGVPESAMMLGAGPVLAELAAGGGAAGGTAPVTGDGGPAAPGDRGPAAAPDNRGPAAAPENGGPAAAPENGGPAAAPENRGSAAAPENRGSADVASRLFAWAVRPFGAEGLDAVVESAHRIGADAGRPVEASRKTPSGTVLSWRLAVPEPLGLGGVQPFLIEWGQTHPTDSDLPTVELASLTLQHPDAEDAAEVLAALGVSVPVSPGPEPRLRATLVTPNGEIVLD